MTRHVTDDEMCPRGYLVRRGSALHRKYRNHPIAHDLDARRNSAPGRGSFPAVSEPDVRAPTTNMDAALFVPEHRSPDGDDEITHPRVSQHTSSEAVENLQVLS
jgi:hypothetical protein